MPDDPYARMRDTNPSQIQAIRIPTGLDCDVRMRAFMGVSGTSLIQEIKILVVQMEMFAPK